MFDLYSEKRIGFLEEEDAYLLALYIFTIINT